MLILLFSLYLPLTAFYCWATGLLLFPERKPRGQGLARIAHSALAGHQHRAQHLIRGGSFGVAGRVTVWQENTCQVPFPTSPLQSSWPWRKLFMTGLHSPGQTHDFALCFSTSPSEIMVLRTNSSQNIACFCMFLHLCPHLRTGSSYYQWSISQVFLPLWKLGKSTFSCQWSAGWVAGPSQPLAWPHIVWSPCTPFLKPGANTASLPSNPLLIHQVSAQPLPPLWHHLPLADVVGFGV